MKRALTIAFLVALSAGARAQGFDFRQKTDVKVVIGTDTLKNAWTGGMNAPVFSKIDLNKDNVEDLYIYDREQSKSFTYLAKQLNGTWQWVYAPEYEALFPTDLQSWVLLRDYDGDGDKDILSQSNLGMIVYRNETPINGPVAFGARKYVKYRSNQTATKTNILYLGAYALPNLSDMDGDGDLDVLAYDFNSMYSGVVYYQNYSKEQFNTSDSLRFVFKTDNWGGFHSCQAPSCNTFVFDADANPISCRVAGTNHFGGGSLLALDLDGDQDKDLISGADSCPDLVKLRNDAAAGSVATGVMKSAGLTTSYPTGTTAASIVNFPAAYSEDVTFDSKPDLLVAPFLFDHGDKPNFKQNSWLYQNNTITATAPPVYSFQKKDFLQDQTIDMSIGSNPVFEDIDGDGDKDMLVGNYLDYRNNAESSSVVYLYTNVGTPNKPVFKLTDTDYLQFSKADNNNGYRDIKLQFGDINNDGKKDLILKVLHISGGAAYMYYIPNQATGSQTYSLSRANQVLLGIDVNIDDSPYFYDLDGDGDLDLLMGASDVANGANSSALRFYRRDSTIDPTKYPAWKLANYQVGNIPVGKLETQRINPLIADLDNDGNPELITNSLGRIRIYRNFINNMSGTFTPLGNSIYNDVLGIYVDPAFGSSIQLAAADLDGDQKPELIAGSHGGGLVYLKNMGTTTATGVKEDLAAALKLNVYPNPARESLTVSSAEKVQVSLFDIAGREVMAKTPDFKTSHQLDVSKLKPGVYFLKFATSDSRSSGRSVLIQR